VLQKLQRLKALNSFDVSGLMNDHRRFKAKSGGSGVIVAAPVYVRQRQPSLFDRTTWNVIQSLHNDTVCAHAGPTSMRLVKTRPTLRPRTLTAERSVLPFCMEFDSDGESRDEEGTHDEKGSDTNEIGGHAPSVVPYSKSPDMHAALVRLREQAQLVRMQ
jgi:hypothetical protein